MYEKFFSYLLFSALAAFGIFSIIVLATSLVGPFNSFLVESEKIMLEWVQEELKRLGNGI